MEKLNNRQVSSRCKTNTGVHNRDKHSEPRSRTGAAGGTRKSLHKLQCSRDQEDGRADLDLHKDRVPKSPPLFLKNHTGLDIRVNLRSSP